MPNYQGFYNGKPLTFQNSGSGSGGESGGEGEVSNFGRPSDWFAMPKPEENEIYLLMLIPDGVESLLAFDVVSKDNYNVELGRVENGEFIRIGAPTTRPSGNVYETILHADEYGGLTTDGMKQVMIKISSSIIYTWSIAKHSSKSSFGIYNIVDIRCNLPSGTKMGVSDSTNVNFTLYGLRYFSWEGPNQLVNASGMFANCYSLIEVSELDTSKVTNTTNMFRLCYSLIRVCDFDLSQVTSAGGMFYNCYSLRYYPDCSTPKSGDVSYMFRYNVSMSVAPKLDCSNATNLEGMFYGCMGLNVIPLLNVTKATNMTDIFTSTGSIGSIEFDPNVSGWAGTAIKLTYQQLGHDGLVKFFKSLPRVTSTRVLTLSGNFGNTSLSNDERAIATGKNWSLTL